MKGRPVNINSRRQYMLSVKVPGRERGRPVDPSSMRQQKLIAKKSVQEPQPTTQHMSFAEIVQGRDSNVRMTHDGLIYAVDLVMVVTGKNRNDSAKDIRNIDPSSFSDNKFVTRKLSGDVCIHATIMNYA
jgi:hypothetical protein